MEFSTYLFLLHVIKKSISSFSSLLCNVSCNTAFRQQVFFEEGQLVSWQRSHSIDGKNASMYEMLFLAFLPDQKEKYYTTLCQKYEILFTLLIGVCSDVDCSTCLCTLMLLSGALKLKFQLKCKEKGKKGKSSCWKTWEEIILNL